MTKQIVYVQRRERGYTFVPWYLTSNYELEREGYYETLQTRTNR